MLKCPCCVRHLKIYVVRLISPESTANAFASVVSDTPLMVNLAVVGQRRTGIANYAINVLPHLQMLNLTLLSPQPREFLQAQGLTTYHYRSVPANLSPDAGKAGHLRRLVWTQLTLPRLCYSLTHQPLGARSPSSLEQVKPLLFSPLPEAPLFSQCRSVVMVHDLIPLRFPNWRSPLTPYFRYYVPRVLAQAQHILCNSKATADEVMQQFGMTAQKLTPIPLGYDASHFRPLNLPTRNYFLYLGRCDPHKNVSRILTAFAQLPKPQAYELWLVGPLDARYTPRLMAQATELGIAAQVKMVDYVPYANLPQILGQAIALVFPSLWEGFGLPVLEAMACGTPVITSNRSALPEVAGDAALLVNPEDVREIAAAMEQVATQPQMRSHLQTAGLARAAQFSWQLTGAQTAAVLQRFL